MTNEFRQSAKSGTGVEACCRILQYSQSFKQYQLLFYKTHGLSLRLLPVSGRPLAAEGRIPNPFCRMAAGDSILAAGCEKTRRRLQQHVRDDGKAYHCRCHAGLTEAGIPIFVEGRHVATLLAGRVLDRASMEWGWAKLERRLEDRVPGLKLKRIRLAFEKTAPVDPKKIGLLFQLLEFTAQHLAADAGKSLFRSMNKEPELVRRVKELVAAGLENISSASQIAEKLHCCGDHLTRVLKKHAGLTLTEFIALSRIEKAKELMAAPGMKIATVAFQAGYGSLSQFNRVFKKATGFPPTVWRSRFLS